MLDSKAIQLTSDNGPNVIQNPMSAHGGPTVNVVEYGENLNLIMDVNLLSTSLSCVKSYFIKNGIFPGCFPECCECQNQLEDCVNLKTRIQSLIDKGFLQCDRIVKNEKVEEKYVEVISIPYTPSNMVGDNSESVPVNAPNVVPGTSSSQEVEELLRLIRKSDYKVIDPLSQTPSKVSILS